MLDGTEDDDDEDDEIAQNKLLILVAKDVNNGTCVATCLREKAVSEHATSWMVSLLRRLGYRRAILQSGGKPSAGWGNENLRRRPLLLLTRRRGGRDVTG